MKNIFWFFIFVVGILAGCGGGGGASSSDTGNVSSTLLSENAVPSNARFKQYQNHLFELQPQELGMAGDTVFLKVYLSSGSVLFLGQIDKYSNFALPLSVPVRDKVLKYDLFSDFDGDQTISGEVVL
ncbi:hypothetical protein [uncultured Photobacterium sp.]|uniref:hypothetical protein n=1 Tax=uncultured Photobacterium sp. TaxID=173973 RepID=UPI00262E2C55|nr:hypothetical protein [uncultured Photobacterium sp.]